MRKSHFLRYGTSAEQKYMGEFRHTYGGVVINANMLAHISKAISAFVHKDVLRKNLFIDPMTHAFQHDLGSITNSQGDIKRSIQKLITFYGPPIDIVIKELRRARSTDFTNENLPVFVENVLDFQHNHITKSLDKDLRDYIEYLQIEKRPNFLIAPYFYLTEENIENWLVINKKCIELGLELKKKFDGLDIYGQLVMDRRLLLNDKSINKIVEYYSDADGLLYWIDDFDETEASIKQLSAVKNFIKKYKGKNPTKKIISLYGGYFSELLLKDELDGVVHGLEYGESRSVVPVGGGIPLSKYYLPGLKKRIQAHVMVTLLKFKKIDTKEKFHDHICNCRVCQETIQSNSIIEDFNRFIKGTPKRIEYKSGTIREVEYPDRESKELCLFHYLEAKNEEFRKIKKVSKDHIATELKNSFETYRNYFSDKDIGYLNRWTQAMKSE